MNNSDFLPPSLLREMSQQKSGSKNEKGGKKQKSCRAWESSSKANFRHFILCLSRKSPQIPDPRPMIQTPLVSTPLYFLFLHRSMGIPSSIQASTIPFLDSFRQQQVPHQGKNSLKSPSFCLIFPTKPQALNSHILFHS